MSDIVINVNSTAYGFPVFGFIEDGPVLPLHPPITFEQITKYFVVSKALPGPIIESHHPGSLSPS